MTLHAEERRLRVLHLEDSTPDHELILMHLRRGGLDAHVLRVETEAQFLNALGLEWDVILCDYNLPGFSGMAALDILKASGHAVPLILISGEIGEDTAVEAMRTGASDYLLKSNLTRLVPAMLHAVQANEVQQAQLRTDIELRESQQRLRELAQYLQTSVEMERAAIAREIHDDVGGSLTALKFDLAWIARHCDSEAVLARASTALETVTHAIEASQRVMHNLRPAILEQGLVAALQWMASRFERRTGVVCHFHTQQDRLELPAGVPLVAYRTAQEALTNVSKHARASQVHMELTASAGVLTLEIRDDGVGLTQEDLTKVGSFGIRGLHERAGTVGGWVDLSRGAGGTTLILSVPLEQNGVSSEVVSKVGDLDDDPTGWGEL